MTKIAELTNSVDPDEGAHYEPTHQNLHCLSSSLWIFNMMQLDKIIIKIFANVNFVVCFLALKELIYTQQQKKRENLFLLNWWKTKYVDFKKYILHVKLTVYYTVSFTCNIHFLNSTYFILNQFKSNKFSRFFCCWVYAHTRQLLKLWTSCDH